MHSYSRIRTIATCVGLLLAGLVFGLVALRNLAECGTVACNATGLLKIRFYLLTLALPFVVGRTLTVFALGIREVRERKK